MQVGGAAEITGKIPIFHGNKSIASTYPCHLTYVTHCVSMKNAAFMIKKALERKGISGRELARRMKIEIGMSQKTVHRRITGEITMEEDEARAFASILFDTRKERERFRRQCALEREKRRAQRASKKTRQGNFISAMNRFRVRPGVSIGVQLTDESKAAFEKRQKEGDPDPLGDAEYKHGGRMLWVEIREKIPNKEKDEPFAVIYADRFILWDKQDNKKTFLLEWPATECTDENMGKYMKFCRQHSVGYFALFDLALDKIAESDVFDEFVYEREKMIPIQKNRLEITKQIIEGGIRWMEENEGIRGGESEGEREDKKRKVLRDHKYLIAELDLFLNSLKDIREARQELQGAIEMWVRRLPSK